MGKPRGRQALFGKRRPVVVWVVIHTPDPFRVKAGHLSSYPLRRDGRGGTIYTRHLSLARSHAAPNEVMQECPRKGHAAGENPAPIRRPAGKRMSNVQA